MARTGDTTYLLVVEALIAFENNKGQATTVSKQTSRKENIN